jgi:hypothetical protein
MWLQPQKFKQTADMSLLMVHNLEYKAGVGSSAMMLIENLMKIRRFSIFLGENIQARKFTQDCIKNSVLKRFS